MTAERESMTLQEMDAPALGVEERRGRGPRGRSQPRAANAGPGGRGQAEEAQVHRAVSTADSGGGRELHAARRGGPAASPRGAVQLHLTEWRRARREGSLQGLTPSKRGRKPAERNPPQREGARARGESGSAGEGAAHRPYDPGRPGKSCRAAGIQPRTREGLLMAVQPLASQVGVAPGVPSAGGATGFLLPSSEARSRASAAPSYARPGPVCVRTRARPRRARQPALRRPVTGRGRRDAAR